MLDRRAVRSTSANLHANADFAGAYQRADTELQALPLDSPLRADPLARQAFEAERMGLHSQALALGWEALRWSCEPDHADYAAWREQQPAVHINVFKVLFRAAARARLANRPRRSNAAAGTAAEQNHLHLQAEAAAVRSQAMKGIREQRQWPRLHQWGINALATAAVDEAINAVGGDRSGRKLAAAFGRAAGAFAAGWVSEWPGITHHTTKGRSVFERVSRDMPKAVGRGSVAFGAVALTALDMRYASRLRDRLILWWF